MAERLIHIGLASYVDADGLNRFGLRGESVDVHSDDLERFDRLNPAPAEADQTAAEGDTPTLGEVDLDHLDLAGLRAYAAEHGIDLGDATRKADIITKIRAAS